MKLKRALALLRLSKMSVKKLLSVPSKNVLGATKISSPSLFLLLFVLVYRHYREAPCADFLGKARGCSPQCSPVGTSLLKWICLKRDHFCPVLLIWETLVCDKPQTAFVCPSTPPLPDLIVERPFASLLVLVYRKDAIY